MRIKITILYALFALLSCGSGKSGDGPEVKQPSGELGKVETYRYSPSVIPSTRFTVSVNGENQLVHETPEPDFCLFGADGRVKVEVRSYVKKIESAVVRPLYRNVEYNVGDDRLTLYMEPGDRFVVEINGDEASPLFLFANPVEEKPSDRSCYKYFEAGGVYDAGQITLDSNQKVYIEGGAVVKGYLSAVGRENVGIEGCGILDDGDNDSRTVTFYKCKGVTMKNVLVRNRNNWTTFIVESTGVRAEGYKVVATASDKADGSGNENDGFDVMGCNDVIVKSCFAYCHDDAFCVKSQKWGYSGETYDVEFDDCVAWNRNCGNSFELGYETGKDVHDVVFRNVCAVHSAGSAKEFRRGAIGLQNGAGGRVHDILYENMWLEDPKEYGIYITIINSGYNIGNDVTWTPGYIEGITFRNISLGVMPPKGNFIAGYDSAEHSIKGVVFENLSIAGKKVTTASEAGFKTFKNTDAIFK